MKSILVFLIVFCFAASSCKIPSVISKRQITAGGITYTNDGEHNGRLADNYYIIKNINNKLEGTEAFPGKSGHYYNIDASALQIDKNHLNKLIAKEFSQKRLNELLSENSFTIHMYMSEYGKVLEMFFSVKSNTKITANELSNIEKSIKSNFSVDFRDRKSFEGINYFTIYFISEFSDLLKIKQQ